MTLPSAAITGRVIGSVTSLVFELQVGRAHLGRKAAGWRPGQAQADVIRREFGAVAEHAVARVAG